MVKAIVYTTNTGHTLEYAKILSKRLNVPYYSVNEAKTKLNEDDEIIYLGWVCASRISGLSNVRGKYNINCVGVVGLYPYDENNIDMMKKANGLNEPLFYLRGGLDYTKLKGIKRLVLQMVGKVMRKGDKQENKEMTEIFKNGANFISEKNLDPIIKHINN
ncbi:MAG: flavodoxin domain-containing protein [Candidatus Dojkabacteria bacterium]|jgi:hypothetical protein